MSEVDPKPNSEDPIKPDNGDGAKKPEPFLLEALKRMKENPDYLAIWRQRFDENLQKLNLSPEQLTHFRESPDMAIGVTMTSLNLLSPEIRAQAEKAYADLLQKLHTSKEGEKEFSESLSDAIVDSLIRHGLNPSILTQAAEGQTQAATSRPTGDSGESSETDDRLKRAEEQIQQLRKERAALESQQAGLPVDVYEDVNLDKENLDFSHAKSDILGADKDLKKRIDEDDPAAKRLLNQLITERVRDRVQARSQEDQRRAQLLAAQLRGRGGNREVVLQPGEMTITINTGYYGDMPIVVNQDETANIEWLRVRLNGMEKVAEGFGSEQNAGAAQEISLRMRALREYSRDPAPGVVDTEEKVEQLKLLPRKVARETADEMQAEYEARVHLHELNLLFEKANGSDELLSAAGLMKAKHFKQFFGREEVRNAFVSFQLQGKEFVAGTAEQREIVRGEVQKAAKGQRWAVDMAEKLWKIGLTMAINDNQVVEETVKLKDKEGHVVKDNDGKPVLARNEDGSLKIVTKNKWLKGDVSNGYFYGRRGTLAVFDIIQRADDDEYVPPINPRLLYKIDLGGQDFIQNLCKQIEDVEKKKKTAEFRVKHGKKDVNEEVDEWWNSEGRGEFIGFSEMPKLSKYMTGDEESSDHKIIPHQDEYSQFLVADGGENLKKVLSYKGFEELPEKFFSNFYNFNVVNPEKIRSALISDSQKAYLRNNSVENLHGFVQMMESYITSGQKDYKSQAVANKWAEDRDRAKNFPGTVSTTWTEREADLWKSVEQGTITAAMVHDVMHKTGEPEMLVLYHDVLMIFNFWTFLLTLLGETGSAIAKPDGRH